MKTVVIVSADGEWGAVKTLMPEALIKETRFGESFETAVDGCHVTFFHGGWGRVSASAATQFVIDHMQPELIVNLGTCGGFRGRIEQGAIILVERTVIYDIVEQMTDPDAAIDHYSAKLDLSWLPQMAPSPVTRGLMLSGDRDIRAEDIPALIRKYDAVAADWESGSIAWVAAKNQKPLLILRGVSDLVDKDGGEVYGDYELFLARSSEIMRRLIDALPKWLEAIETVQPGQRV